MLRPGQLLPNGADSTLTRHPRRRIQEGVDRRAGGLQPQRVQDDPERLATGLENGPLVPLFDRSFVVHVPPLASEALLPYHLVELADELVPRRPAHKARVVERRIRVT